ncbi:hypothetical protein B0H15DRAFT_244732 [Mycena belliarum]|uniref:Uncharacterized protein n=1 Tax=Mycena belliarum TaxID=1033014 RepID=A0AAD6UA66_9AGAR|nr:hypothetical protein B0H15DRAFT_244732 [Mycena belliae]
MSDSLSTISRDKMLGALLIGTYANSFLYILEVVEVIKYFRRHARLDVWILRVAVILALIVDTLDTAASNGLVYLGTITHWGDTAFSIAGSGSVIVPVFVGLTGVSAAISRLSLAYHYWKITTRRVATLIFFATILFALVSTGLFAVATADPSRTALRVPGIIWSASSLGANAPLALALFLAAPPTTYSFASLCTVTLQTGGAGAAFALGTLLLFLLDKDQSNLPFALIICLGRVYTHAMLRTLNARTSPPSTFDVESPAPTVPLARYPFMPFASSNLNANSDPRASVASSSAWLDRRPKLNISAPMSMYAGATKY